MLASRLAPCCCVAAAPAADAAAALPEGSAADSTTQRSGDPLPTLTASPTLSGHHVLGSIFCALRKVPLVDFRSRMPQPRCSASHENMQCTREDLGSVT